MGRAISFLTATRGKGRLHWTDWVSYGYLCLGVFLMFGHVWPVAITTLTAVITVLWTMAFAVVLDRNLHILTTVIPCVILIIALVAIGLTLALTVFRNRIGQTFDNVNSQLANAPTTPYSPS